MKKSVLFVIGILLSVFLYSQEVQYEDVVYLKNGSIIHGMIIEQIPNETIKIKTADRNVFVFEFDQIEKITKEEVLAGEVPAMNTPDAPPEIFESRQSGFEGTADMYFAVEFEYGEPVLGMDLVAGYRFIPQFFVGGGIGFEFFIDGNMMPLFLQLRADFVEGKVSPFFTLNGGYSFGWLTYGDGSDYGGMFMEPGIGIRINFSKNFGMNLGSTFKFQRAQEPDYYYGYDPYSSYYYDSRQDITYRMFTFKVGFTF